MFHIISPMNLNELPYPGPNLAGPGIHTAAFGFLPAFRDLKTGETHLCMNADGSLSNIHLFDGLPAAWVAERDRQGHAVALRTAVIAGYLRNGRFYTHAQIKRGLRDA